MMKSNSIKKKLLLFITLALDIVLFAAVVFLMNHVQELLYDDTKINLIEVVTQNKDVINSKISLEVGNLQIAANSILERFRYLGNMDESNLRHIFFEYCNENKESQLYASDLDGTAFFPDGTILGISGRTYFRQAVTGIRNISSRLVSRLNGEEIFVISVPLMHKGIIYGTLHQPYSPEEMYKICSLSLFSEQGQMYIINKEGYILINSDQLDYDKETENIFRLLYAQGNQDASKQIENDIKNNQSGFMEAIINGQKIFAAYTPINEFQDWYLISSVTTQAISGNAEVVIRIFFCVLSAIVLIFAVSIFYFLSYKNKQQANLEHLAFVDNITGGNTLTKFVLDLRQILHNNPEKQFYLLKFDIDNFKYVNNYYGFDCGDRILRYINSTIKKQLQAHESIARVSSDHFAALLEDATEKRLNALRNSIQNEEGITLYFSAGLYKITNPSESINLMLDKASMAAQSIKGKQLDKFAELYTEKFDRQMIHNEQMKRAIKQALADSEIIPFFQPKIHILTGELKGAEALARWQTKENKFIQPAEFIPICEKTGLIVELDMMIFEKTLQFLQKQLRQKIKCVPISVNFSRLHLTTGNFIDLITEKISLYEIPPNLIEVELTETVIFDNHEIITAFIQQLHEKGLLISMDDFGSGYSSLNMLKDIPIDVLKLDRGFLMDTADTRKRNIIFASIVQMAERLNIKIVVEGVETRENVELMKELGCLIAQGYYYAKPMDAQAFDILYKKGSICEKDFSN